MNPRLHQARFAAPHRHMAGLSLIEVLVSVLILSLGLLGLAALQVFGMKFTHQSYERTQATVFVDDIVERMRANRLGVTTALYDLRSIGYQATVPGTACGATYTPSPSHQADCDIEHWIAKLGGSNAPTGYVPPLAQATVNIIPIISGETYQIVVSWVETTQQGGVQGTMNQTAFARLF